MSSAAPKDPERTPAGWFSEGKYRSILHALDDGFCIVRVELDSAGNAVDYTYLETNPSFEKHTGLANVIGRSIRELSPQHEEHWFRMYGEVARTGKPARIEAPAMSLGRWYEVEAFRVGEASQHLVAVLFKDITRRKELEGWIESQNAHLREADLRKDRFLATLSHELRNPLAPLKVAADLLGQPDLSEKELGKTREIIRRQVGNMARMLDDLLDISRVTQGKLALRRQRVSPTELIDSAVEGVRPLIERKQHGLEVRLGHGKAKIDVDTVRMSQVVSNLLGNAAKYTDPGGRIVLGTRVEGRTFVLEVTDNGIGIATEALPSMFEMFWQQPSAGDRAEGGLGIGLALVRGLMELHGGTVEVDSEGTGKGSRFTIRLPVVEGGVEDSVAQAEVGKARSGRRKVLVADDNRDAAESLAILLAHFGHEVRVAYDGQAAIAMARTFQPEAAVLDIGMPKMSGYEVAKALRAEPWGKSLLIVAATGWGDAEARKSSFEAGFDHHLTKPVDPEELQRLLGEP